MADYVLDTEVVPEQPEHVVGADFDEGKFFGNVRSEDRHAVPSTVVPVQSVAPYGLHTKIVDLAPTGSNGPEIRYGVPSRLAVLADQRGNSAMVSETPSNGSTHRTKSEDPQRNRQFRRCAPPCAGSG